MQAISASTPHFERVLSPHSFSSRQFQRSASSSDCMAMGTAFSASLFFFFFSIVYLLFMQKIFWRLKMLFFLRQAIFSLRECFYFIFFSRQEPRWSGLTSKACVMTALWKGTCSNEFRSGCYLWASAKLFLWNRFRSVRAGGAGQRREPIHSHNIQIVYWLSPLQLSAILKALKESL